MNSANGNGILRPEQPVPVPPSVTLTLLPTGDLGVETNTDNGDLVGLILAKAQMFLAEQRMQVNQQRPPPIVLARGGLPPGRRI
jgi:hypothetical protein